MDADERDICLYLKSWPGQFVSVAVIARRAASKRRFEREPDWAAPVLQRLVDRGIVETDSTGHYRLRPRPKKEKDKRWVSPQVQRILQQSKKFEGTYQIVDDDDELLDS